VGRLRRGGLYQGTRVIAALLNMNKLDIGALEGAYDE